MSQPARLGVRARPARILLLVAAVLLLASPAGAQPAAAPFAIIETGPGTVSLLGQDLVIELAEGLLNPTSVATSDVDERIHVGLAGGGPGLGAIVVYEPGQARRTLAWGLPGVAGLAVLDGGGVLFASGVDGTVRALAPDGSVTGVADSAGQLVGLAVLPSGDVLTVPREGQPQVVDPDTGAVIAVVGTPVGGGGQPAVVEDLGIVCIPDRVADVVTCVPYEDSAATVVLEELTGPSAVIVDRTDPARVVVAGSEATFLVDLRTGDTVHQWTTLGAVAVAPVASLQSWLEPSRSSPTTAPSVSEPGGGADGDVVLLALAVLAGVGAIVLLAIARRARTSFTEESGEDVEDTSAHV